MRFLCLHGAGTNSKVFELQTAALRYELGGGHVYEFVEGVILHDKAPGIESLAASDDAYFAYYDPRCAQSFEKAVQDLEQYLVTEGTFDGIMAFSQGASLASTVLLDASKRSKSGLRCAIFFCGRTPFADPETLPYFVSNPVASVKDQDAFIDLPTVHVWGANDKIEPGQGQALSRLCRPQDRYTHIHAGGHEVPGAKDQKGMVESANAIRRMLARL